MAVSISVSHPDLALRIVHEADRQRSAGSLKRVLVWCANGHPRVEYEQSVLGVRDGRNGCTHCGSRAPIANSHPDLALRIVHEADRLTPAGAPKKVLVWCADGHEREEYMQPVQGLKDGQNSCTWCGQYASVARTRPDIAARLVLDKDKRLGAGSQKRVLVWCADGHEREEYMQAVGKLTEGANTCPACGYWAKLGKARPDLAARLVDQSKRNVPLRSPKKVLVWCANGHERVEYEQRVVALTEGSNICPACGYGAQVRYTHPDLSARLVREEDRNCSAASLVRVLVTCADGHERVEYEQPLLRLRDGHVACPACKRLKTIAVTHPDLALRIVHPEDRRRGSRTPTKVLVSCANGHPEERYMQPVCNLTGGQNGCPVCGMHSIAGARHRERLAEIVEGILESIDELSDAELVHICQRWRLNNVKGGLGQALLSRNVETVRRTLADLTGGEEPNGAAVESDGLDETVFTVAATTDTDAEDDALADEAGQPAHADGSEVTPEQFLAATDTAVRLSHRDGPDNVRFLIGSRVAHAWRRVFAGDDVDEFVDGLREAELNEFTRIVVEEFLRQYDAAVGMAMPSGWQFRPERDAAVVQPNLMQRHLACLVAERRQVGNWSSTGAGKTVSTVLAARHIAARTVVVICPNGVVEGWARTAQSCFADNQVATRTLSPVWDGPGPRWVIINYDMLPGHEGEAQALIDSLDPDMLVVDEVHWAKDRRGTPTSQRREVLMGLRRRLRADAAVLGMSATPVVNDLSEGASLIELIDGVRPSIDTRRVTITNVIALHEHMLRVGFRAVIDPEVDLDVSHPQIDLGSEVADSIASSASAHPAALDAILAEAYRDHVVATALACRARGRGLVIYSEYVQGIIAPLRAALRSAGLTVALYTGAEKIAIADLTDSGVDVLIGTSAIGTGIDGIQYWADTLYLISLPWTGAAYEQVVGRVHRQGTKSERVSVVIPTGIVHGPDGRMWSWTKARWRRVANKRTIAAAVVDGDIPAEFLVSPGEATKAALSTLAELRRHAEVMEPA